MDEKGKTKKQLSPVLRQPLTVLKGVSTRRAALLRGLEIENLWDLLRYFPRLYEDWTSLTSIGDLADGQEQVFLAQVARTPGLRRKGKLSMVQTVLRDQTGSISATWFNQPYLVDKLKKGEVYLFRGKIRRSGRYFDIANPHFEVQQMGLADEPADVLPPGAEEGLPSPEAEADTFVRPIYPLTQGLTQAVFRDLVRQAMQICLPEIPEALPSWLRRRAQLCAAAFAYEQIHFPEQRENYLIARRRLAFEELFLTQLGLRLARRSDDRSPAPPLMLSGAETIRRFEEALQNLPFRLTEAQTKALRDVLLDLRQDSPMNRLIQGDVGSGKTAVAALAMRYTALAGAQSVMMAPTSILAQQHYQTLLTLLPDLSSSLILLTGQTPAAERRRILSRVADGSCSILVGTHAVLEDQVVFRTLGLAVTDEQHRFGVSQRLRLSQQDQGKQPHVLVMSATPIPRSLALILYGDLDISVIDEKPAGRQPIATYTAGERDRGRILDMVRKRTADGELVYWVCPLIEKSEESQQTDRQMVSVEEAFERLSEELEPDGIKVGMLHGRLKDREKQKIMEAFSDGDIQVLVSTTVIEVGVDQPRATLMVIENAERFGLAQLHQLRGRIGRGERASLCILMTEVTEGIAYERVATLCRTEDGFEIAEADLRLRGPGDFFGTKQHGIPVFRLANLYEDQELLALSSELLGELLAEDPMLESVDNRYLVPALFETFGAGFEHITL